MVNADADQVADVTLLPHTVRLFVARAKRLGLSWAALFTDVVAAFHSTIRQFCIGHLHSDESVAALLRRFGLDAADFHDLCAELTGPTEFPSAGVHHQLEAFGGGNAYRYLDFLSACGTGACYSQQVLGLEIPLAALYSILL